MYSMKSRVRYSETDSGQKMTFQALTNYLQDCCIFQSEDLGIGVDYLKEHAQAWFLASWQIVVERLPVLGEKITVKTWPYNFKGFYGYRNFTIEDAEGKIYAYADSQWIFMDLKRERPARISDKMLEEYQMEEPFKMDYADRKIKLPEKMQEKESFQIRPEQIDTNHHVNNEQYIAMAKNYLPENFNIHKMRAEYRKAAVLGDKVFPFVYADDKMYLVSLADEEQKPYAIVEFEQ
ncbi:acyl-[acyl-carrier-protein] thioesterase [Roseburia sp. AF15-21]|jgi:medium-chain acyl-[acyl-carrier-protein] hydrolase|uniref:acyl-[acyl-carrier-protein] thioesterase n=1 Tax=unclassified Roseburia TaxID=2637578 RepID=UPI000E4A5040|nr:MULTISPECIES: acyl-ACP thioesterase domain-containing protein [unclassified Roseburia]RGG51770.1 acyl-[acyl-carrier-protein] thioesterase [Roseburia sp. AF20-18LB]RHR87246.1 acyl-[acyl-carrier-protein] thioesterase [Roseburia sp. AF15-21]RHS27426.1 acyl-[acyl-carrier-protein] thioesterase [Roseburia sp. AF12-17LB]